MIALDTHSLNQRGEGQGHRFVYCEQVSCDELTVTTKGSKYVCGWVGDKPKGDKTIAKGHRYVCTRTQL